MSNQPILRAHDWLTNGHLVADVAKLGYLKEHDYILDATFGEGTFWNQWRPLSEAHGPGALLGMNNLIHPWWDFTDMRWSDGKQFKSHTFDAVVYDPPYKLSGTPSLGGFDDRYGINKYVRWQDRIELILLGQGECIRVLRPGGILLVKCMDQVCSGAVRWQTDLVTERAFVGGCKKIDRFDFMGGVREQPPGRSQKHAAANYSTLLVFSKSKRA